MMWKEKHPEWGFLKEEVKEPKIPPPPKPSVDGNVFIVTSSVR
jgi:hypothetical protein